MAGYVFHSREALAIYASMLNEGLSSRNGASDPGTSLRLTTVGAAGVLPLRDYWRLQGSVFADVMLSAFGRNQSAGIGFSASLVRVWM